MEIEYTGEEGGVVGGKLKLEKLLNTEQLGGKCALYARVTIPSGTTLKPHYHHGETETYFILSGEGIYSDNGKEVPAKANDVFFCKDGDSHGIENNGSEDLVFMALIIYS